MVLVIFENLKISSKYIILYYINKIVINYEPVNIELHVSAIVHAKIYSCNLFNNGSK